MEFFKSIRNYLTIIFGLLSVLFLRAEDYGSPVLLQTFYGHQDDVFDVEIHPNQKVVISVSADQSIKIWSLERGTLIRDIKNAHKVWVYRVSIHPDGKTFATTGCDIYNYSQNECLEGVIKIWNIQTGQVTKVLPGHKNSVWALKYIGDGNLLVSGGKDKNLFFWDVDKKLSVLSFSQNNGTIHSLDVSKKFIIYAEDLGSLKVFNLQTAKQLSRLNDHTQKIWSVSFDQKNLKFASGGLDKRIVVRDLIEQKTFTIENSHRVSTSVVKFNLEGNLLASAGCDDLEETRKICRKSLIKLWNEKGELISTATGHGEWGHSLTNQKELPFVDEVDGIWDLEYTKDSQKIVSAGRDGLIKVWDIDLINRRSSLSDAGKKSFNKVMEVHQKSLEKGKAVFYSSRILNEYSSPISKKLGIRVPVYSENPKEDIERFTQQSIEDYLSLKDKNLPNDLRVEGINFEFDDNRKETYTTETLAELNKLANETKENQLVILISKVNAIAKLRIENIDEMEKFFKIEGFRKVMKNFRLKYPAYKKDENVLEMDLVADGADYKERVQFKVSDLTQAQSLAKNLVKKPIVVLYEADRDGEIKLKSVVYNQVIEGHPVSLKDEKENEEDVIVGEKTEGQVKEEVK